MLFGVGLKACGVLISFSFFILYVVEMDTGRDDLMLLNFGGAD